MIMITDYSWFKIFDYDDFDSTELPSRTYSVYLTGLGLKNILVTKGNYIGMVVDDNFLCLEVNARSPFYFNSKAIFKNSLGEVYYGVLNED